VASPKLPGIISDSLGLAPLAFERRKVERR